MKRTVFLLIFLLPMLAAAQSLTFQVDTLFQSGNPGSLFQFHGVIINNTTDTIHVQVIRTQNQIPAAWTSSLCLGITCYPPDMDTVDFSLEGGASINFILDVLSDPNTPGTGMVTVRVQNRDNPADFSEKTFTATTQPTGIRQRSLPLTGQFQLYANYPNPFNPTTTIPFEVGGHFAQPVTLTVYNILGQPVKVLLQKNLSPGLYEVTWDGRDSRGVPVAGGVYFYELTAGSHRLTGKMILMK